MDGGHRREEVHRRAAGAGARAREQEVDGAAAKWAKGHSWRRGAEMEVGGG